MFEVAKGRNILDAWGEMSTFVAWNMAMNFPVVGHAFMAAEMLSKPPSEWTMADDFKPAAAVMMIADGKMTLTDAVNLTVGTGGGVVRQNVAATYMSYLMLIPPMFPDLPKSVNLYHMVCQFARVPVDDDGYDFKLELAPGCNPIGKCLEFNSRTGWFDVVPMKPVITSMTLFSYGPDQRLKLAGQCLAANGSDKGFYLRPDDSMSPEWLFLGNGSIVLKKSRRQALIPTGLYTGAALFPELIPLYEEFGSVSG